MLENGWVKFHRKMVEWEWYSDHSVRGLFMHLLLTANYETKKWHGIEIKPGEKVTSLAILAQETGLTLQSTRTALFKLKSTGEIEETVTNKFRLVKIKNWDKYQMIDSETNNQATVKQQSNNNQLTTKEEGKKDKKDKNIPIAARAAPRLSEVKVLEPIDPSPKALLEDPKHHVRVIGLFALAKGVTFENREQRDSFIRRNVRAASDLKGYETERVKQVMDWLNQNADYKWTLESVGKHIDEYGRLVKQGESLEDALKKIQQSDYGN